MIEENAAMFRWLTLALVIAWTAFTVPAMAAGRDSDLPRPDPKGHWRVVTQDDATSTSKCIGKPVTPLCAVESFLACVLRADATICPGMWDDDGVLVKNPKDRSEKYRIVSVGRFKPGDPKQDEMNHPLDWLPGDMWIVLDMRDCSKDHQGHAYCDKPTPSVRRYLLVRYIVRKQPDGWNVVETGALHPER